MTQKSTPKKAMLGRVFALARPYRFLFLLAALLAVALAPISIIRPYLVQVTVDEHILRYDGEGLWWMTQLLFAFLLLEGFLTYIFTYLTGWLGQSVIRDLRLRVFKHINRLRLSYFDRTPIGASTTRTISDIETINTVFSEGVITIAADLLTLIVVIGMMFWTSWSLSLICMTTLPLLLWATRWFQRSVKRTYETVRTQVSAMNAFLQERITGMRVVQIFNAEKAQAEEFAKINRRYTKANIESIFYYALFFPIVEILSAASLGLLVWYGARGVLSEEISVGVLVAFPLYLGMLFRPVRMLADKFNSLQMGLVSAGRVFDILDNEPQEGNQGQASAQGIRGEIVFDRVRFSYEQDNPEPSAWILDEVSFRLPAGQTLAIVGGTGAGKTTIINIINRFYTIHQGTVLVDGLPIEQYELYGLRRQIAIVLQDVFLFSGSIFENISLKDPSISRQQVEDAARLIGAHDFIERLPGGYDYQVMERGATLSMGQRQLISFVRALVFDPRILILDEATSSIDPETEGLIQHAIERLIAKRTSIIIAHRLSTIQHANQILVLDKGKVAEIGTHAELMQQPQGMYRALVETAQVMVNG